MYKVFIDGSNGTTGLKIKDRLSCRDDIDLVSIEEPLRKDISARLECINSSDFAILCLPDEASIEIADKAKDFDTVIIDASTAHRTNEDWAYGFAELGSSFRENIKTNKKIAVPGCYASGFISIVYPLIHNNIVSKDANLSCFAFSGYTGAGKLGISQYKDNKRYPELDSPRIYGLTQQHKHLKEMKKITGLPKEPIFVPAVCDFPQGMLVNIGIFKEQLQSSLNIKDIWEIFNEFYRNTNVIKVRDFGYSKKMIGSSNFAGRDDMEIEITGNDDRILISSRFDNLGKGASGAAVQCMNISMGIDEATGLVIGD